MARFIQLAMAASDFAVQHGRSSKSRRSIADATGVYIGSGIGGFDVIEREHSKYLNGGPGKISPFFIPSAIVNLAAGNVSIRYGAKGPNSATATACSAGAHAVGDAYKIIQRCDAEVMIAGGSEAAVTPMSIGGFGAMRALSTRNDEPERASRPFDAQPRRIRGRRRLGHADPRVARIRPAPRREYHRRDRRLRNVRRRVSHHAAGRGRRRRLSRVARGHQGRENHAGRRRLRQRARHFDAHGRRDRDGRAQAASSASARRKFPSARRNR